MRAPNGNLPPDPPKRPVIDRDAEAARMEAELSKLDDPRVRCAILNARRICARRWKKSPNWSLASEVFGLGSTYSWNLCKRHGIDPDATS